MSNLKQLQEEFDKVFIKYGDKSCEVILVKGLRIFKGLSKCHEDDQFDRKLGRTIALGRAEFASKVIAGDKSPRDFKIKNHHGLSTGDFKSSSVQFGDINELDECIIEFLPSRNKAKEGE